MNRPPAIGIDLGTTNSCVGVYEVDKGKIEILANEQGSRTTPSVVAFTERERLIGEPAKYQAARNPDNTIYDVKRLIGKKDVENPKHWFYKILPGERKVKIPVAYKGEKKLYKPEEISSMILTKMKDIADGYIGMTVTDAVITVPAYFTNRQKKATLKAGQIAGLNVLRLINEPAAAAIAYGLHRDHKKEKNIFVFDLGGGTFDVSILSVFDNTYKMLAINGDNELGGRDFDDKMVTHFIRDFRKKYRLKLFDNRRTLHRLKAACERAKVILSGVNEAAVDMEISGEDYQSTITRALFNNLTKDLIERLRSPMEAALADAKLSVEDIHDVVLIGGSTRIVRVQEFVKEFFSGKEPHKSINPDEAVAFGAAALAANLNGEEIYGLTKDLMLQDVTPLSLGIGNNDGGMDRIIERNTPIPVSKTSFGHTTPDDNLTSINFPVGEGERVSYEDNFHLDEFTVEGFPALPRGQVKFEVTFDIDINGILQVSARETATGKQNKITVNKAPMSASSIERMIVDAEHFKEHDRKEKKRIDMKNVLENFAYDLRREIESVATSDTLSSLEKIKQTTDWINENPYATEEEISQKLLDLKSL